MKRTPEELAQDIFDTFAEDIYADEWVDLDFHQLYEKYQSFIGDLFFFTINDLVRKKIGEKVESCGKFLEGTDAIDNEIPE